MAKNEQISLAIPVNMASFMRLAVAIGPNIPLCVRGRHAIGKSEGVHQAAEQIFSNFYKDEENCKRFTEACGGERSIQKRLKKFNKTVWSYEMGLPVIERRLSQMTEGDIIGLPFASKDGASTTFKPCDWLINSCKFPAVLFLDERNRALPGVKQAVFQLMDSKAFYGNCLHDETRIIVAENIGASYEVNQTDPAEVSRAATVTLVPGVDEWLILFVRIQKSWNGMMNTRKTRSIQTDVVGFILIRFCRKITVMSVQGTICFICLQVQ